DVQYDIDAPYLALTYSTGGLTLDGSVRRDYGDANGRFNATVQATDFDVNGDGIIQQTERSVSLVDVANPQLVDYDWSYTSYSFGANYLFNDDLAAFARVSRGGRANADRLLFGLVQPDGDVRRADAIDFVNQQEAGIKWRRGDLSLFATGFRAITEEQNFELTSQRFFDREFRAFGVEIEAAYSYEGFAFNGGVTWTDAEIRKDAISPANQGNTPRRQADLVYQLTAAYSNLNYRGGVNVIGTTDSFAQDSNELQMPGYAVVSLFADYLATDNITVSLNVNNLFDTFAITESEEGSIVAGAENIIRARTIPGRTALLSLRYDF
ncbi:MAG: TonB-dependent receptor, partial [Gammaproteobacteria bacterium HGW-Gammaproteobacteria-7]